MALIPLKRLIPGALSAYNAGVPADTTGFVGLRKGGIVQDTTGGKLYVNTGTAAAPAYIVAGAQS